MATDALEQPTLQRDALQNIHDNDDGAIAELVAIRVEEAIEDSELDAKSFALVNLGRADRDRRRRYVVLLHVGAILDAGASVDEVTDVLTAVGPIIGVFKMVAAADTVATAATARPATPANR